MQVHCGCEVCGGEAGNGWVTGARRRARTTLNIAAAAGNVVCQGGPCNVPFSFSSKEGTCVVLRR